MNISIVVPVFNSQHGLVPLIAGVREALDGTGCDWETILVNDGSADQSWAVICELAAADRRVRGIDLMRNYGQHNALLCGIRAARYDVTVTIDDDLQHPPGEIPKLLAKLAEGFDVVYGIPERLQHDPLRNFASRALKRVAAAALRIDTIRDVSAFRAFRTYLREAFAEFRGQDLSIDALLTWGTRRFGAVRVTHDRRRQGQSNYGFRGLARQTIVMLIGFSTVPLRFASLVGFSFTVFGGVVLVYVIGRYLVGGGSIPGFPFLACLLAIFSGTQLFALGVVGEYLARIFDHSMERRSYVILGATDDQRR
jgi:glycosyltransferase involved in cell wall biosynthesis